MGLDMYAFSVAKADAISDFEVRAGNEGGEGHVELAYWRKFNALQGWMEDLYRAKGGTVESFNCVAVRLTQEDLNELEYALIENKLEPREGFFFGSQEINELHIKATYEFIAKAHEAINEGREVYYDSWW
jgi:hypothetical protein